MTRAARPFVRIGWLLVAIGSCCSKDERAASAVEFALIAPVFCLLAVGAIDFGGALYTKFNLDSAVSAAANYAIQNAADVDSTSGSSLAADLAAIVASEHATSWANATIVVNNGPTVTLTSGAMTSAGTASNADLCYCPTTSASGLTWGSAIACGTTCAAGGVAGKFVSVLASRPYQGVFSTYGIINDHAVSSSAVVQAQ